MDGGGLKGRWSGGGGNGMRRWCEAEGRVCAGRTWGEFAGKLGGRGS